MRRVGLALAAFAPIIVLAACATGETLDAETSDLDGSVVDSAGGGTSNLGGGTSVGTAGFGGSGLGGTLGGGGASVSAGASGVGGASNAAGASSSGGAKSTGGASSTGGAKSTGGASNTGGASSTGGATGAGGTLNTGGATGTGGATSVCNGLTASLTTDSGGDCDEADSAGEVTSLFSKALETHNVSAGWNFDTQQPADQSPSGPTFGFTPPFTNTTIGWRVRYQGFLVVPEAGQYCFKVDVGSAGNTSPPDACGEIYVPGTGAAFVVNGRKQGDVSAGSRYQTRCTTFAAAGPQSIQFLYQYSSNSAANRHQFEVSYCFGGAAACTNYAPIPLNVLTPLATNLPCP